MLQAAEAYSQPLPFLQQRFQQNGISTGDRGATSGLASHNGRREVFLLFA